MISKRSASLLSRRCFARRLLQWCSFPFLARGAWAADRQIAPVLSEHFLGLLQVALNGAHWTPSTELILQVPQIAENGAMVPITIESLLPDTRRILIFAEKNPAPLLAEFWFEPGADPWVSLRLKLNETGPVLVITEAGGRFYGVTADVRVMVGGCG